MTTDHAIVDLLPWYAAGTLGSEERTHVEAHLQTCARCRDELAQWRAVGAAFARSDERISVPAADSWTVLAMKISRVGVSYSSAAMTREPLNGHMSSRPMVFSSPSLGAHNSPTRRPWVRAVSTIAGFALIVAIVGALLVTRQLPSLLGPAPLPVGQWTQIRPLPSHTGLPDFTELTDLAMVSPDEGWAVGRQYSVDVARLDPTHGSPDKLVTGLILHFQHGAWTVAPESPKGVILEGVRMASPTEGWAYGQAMSADSGYSATVFYHLRDGQWSASRPPFPLPYAPAGNVFFKIYSMQLFALSDIWFQGELASSGGRLHVSEEYWHYDGHTLTQVKLPGQEQTGAVVLSLNPIGPNEAIALCAASGSDGHQVSVIYHIQDGVATRTPLDSQQVLLHDVTAVSRTDVWATGADWSGPDEPDWITAIYHFDGTSWTRENLKPPHGVTGITMIGHEEGLAFTFTEDFDPRYANDPGTLHVTGAYHFASGQWSKIAWPAAPIYSIQTISVLPDGEAWALGDYTLAWANPSLSHGYVSENATVLMHYVKGKWVQYTGQ